MGSQYNSKRILKNTVLLYIRMIVVTLVSFFTVRITLRVLGVEDYGIYNVVGGLVAFLGIINATISSASQRYLAFDLGKKDINSFQNTFSILWLVYLALSLIVIVLGEALGPWIISHYLNIPSERVFGAQWVYQFSLLSFCITLMSTPYQASIIAYEKMGIFAFVGLFDAICKLIFTILLNCVPFDKLIVYAFFILLISLANLLIQLFYCKIKLFGCSYKYYWNKSYIKEIIGYTGWNLFGAVSGTLNTAGVSLVLNLFFGPIVNAAKSIADRINSLVVSFSVNFYQAISPQVVKTYASGESERSLSLVYKSSKLSFFLLFVLSLPLIYGMSTVLNIWLGADEVTSDMIVFSKLILIYSLINVFEQPITMLIRATGNIKRYQVSVGIITLSTVPVCIVLFLMGLPAYWSIISLIIMYVIALFVRLHIARIQTGLSIVYYTKTVLIPTISVVSVSVSITEVTIFVFDAELILSMIVSFIIAIVASWFIGLKRKERILLINKIHFNNT